MHMETKWQNRFLHQRNQSVQLQNIRINVFKWLVSKQKKGRGKTVSIVWFTYPDSSLHLKHRVWCRAWKTVSSCFSTWKDCSWHLWVNVELGLKTKKICFVLWGQTETWFKALFDECCVLFLVLCEGSPHTVDNLVVHNVFYQWQRCTCCHPWKDFPFLQSRKPRLTRVANASRCRDVVHDGEYSIMHPLPTGSQSLLQVVIFLAQQWSSVSDHWGCL